MVECGEELGVGTWNVLAGLGVLAKLGCGLACGLGCGGGVGIIVRGLEMVLCSMAVCCAR